MKLENRFSVPVPRDQAWQVLLDVERIAPCLPGAKVLSRDGDSFTGQVKVKLGPINLTYGGTARFVELDEAGGVAVIDASGKETRGTGTAKATITCRLVEQGSSTDIVVDTDLAITGKPAQFGRGVLADVSAKLVDQFAACLAEEIQEGSPVPAGAAAPEPAAAGDPAAGGPAAEDPTDPAAPADPVPVAGGPDLPGAAAAAPVATPAPGASDGAAQQPAPAAAASGGLPAATPAADERGPAGGAAPAGSALGTGTGTPTGPASGPARPARQQAEAIDLLDTAGMPVAKRLAPVLAVLAVLALVVRALRR